MQNGLPNKEEILAEKRKDLFCNTWKPGTHSRKSVYFLDDDGVLYKRRSDHKQQLVVPKSLVEDTKVNHDLVYVAIPEQRGLLTWSLLVTGGLACGRQWKIT